MNIYILIEFVCYLVSLVSGFERGTNFIDMSLLILNNSVHITVEQRFICT